MMQHVFLICISLSLEDAGAVTDRLRAIDNRPYRFCRKIYK